MTGGVRSAGRTALRRFAHTWLGFRALRSLAESDPLVLMQALGPRVNDPARFSSVSAWPERLEGFEDLAFLFSGHPLHGIISMAVDEAAYLFRLVRDLRPRTLVEIGRFKGGSTLLLAAAMGEDARLWSYDLHVKRAAGADADRELGETLMSYGLRDRVELVLGDSRTAPAPPDAVDLVLLDGDHTYEGARADYERWRTLLRPRGHLVLHDAVATRDLAYTHDGVVRLVEQIEASDPRWFRRAGAAGTLLDLERTDEPAPWAG